VLRERQHREYTKQDIENIFLSVYNNSFERVKYIIEREDFVQECWLKFISSGYDKERASKSTFARIIASSVLSNLIIFYNRKKNTIRRNTFSVDFTENRDQDRFLIDKSYFNIDGIVYGELKDAVSDLKFGKFKSGIVSGDFILDVLLLGGNNKDIADRYKEETGCEVNPLSTQSWVRKIKNKLRERYQMI